MGCGSEAAGSQPREKTPGCCGLNCLVQQQKATLKKKRPVAQAGGVDSQQKTPKKRPVAKATLKKNARWLKRAVATRKKKRQKNALWLLKRAAAARETKRPVAGHSGNCLKKVV